MDLSLLGVVNEKALPPRSIRLKVGISGAYLKEAVVGMATEAGQDMSDIRFKL